MAVYNPRLDISRQAGGSPQVQSLSQILKNQALASTAGGLVRRNIYEEPAAQGGGAPDVGGWKGVLMDVMESPVGKVFSKAGEIVSLPGRVVTSAVQEFADALDTDPNTVASWNDFGRQVKDPTFGFGTVIGDLTGVAWIDRALGFAGDVVLDPLTYVTLGAGKGMSIMGDVVEAGTKSIKITGRAGREALGARVLKFTGDAELAGQVVRYGRTALRHQADDVFERIGLDRAGVYFMGKRIPASTRAGQMFESGLTNMRVWSGDHIFSKPAQWFTPDDVNTARVALQRGTAAPERVETYLRMILSGNEQKAAKAAERRWVQQELSNLINDIGQNDLRSVQKTLHQVLEAPDPQAVANVSGISLRAAEKVSAFFDNLWNRVDAAAKAADPNVNIGKIERYFHHMLTDDASAFLQAGRSKNARDLAEILFNPIKDTGAFQTRMKVGDDFFGKVLEEGDLTVGRLNQIAREAGFKGDFFETDLAAVLNKYADQYAAQMGVIARRQYLVDNKVPILKSTIAKTDQESFKATSKVIKSVVKGASDNTKAASKSVDRMLNQIVKSLDQANLMLTKSIEETAGERSAALQEVLVSKLDKMELSIALDEAETLLEEKVGALASLYDAEPPMIVTLMEKQHQKALDAVSAAKNDLDNLTASAQATAERLREIKTLIDEVETTRDGILEFGNALEEHLDDVFLGRRIAGGADDEIPKFLRDLKTAVGDSVDVAGTRRKNVEEFIKGPEWAEINRYAPLSQNDLINTSYEQVNDIVVRTMRGEANVGEIRTALAWYASAFPHLREMQPELWKQMFEGAEGAPSLMAKAAKADEFFNGVAKAREANKEYVRLADMNVRLNSVNAEVRDSFSEYVAAQRMLRDLFGDNPDSVLSLADGTSLSGGLARAQFEDDAAATLKMWLQRPEYEPLIRRFESFLLPEDDLIGYVGVPKSFTFDDLVKRVRGVVDEFRTTGRIEVELNPVGLGDAAEKLGKDVSARKLQILFSDFADDLDLIVRHGTDEDVAQYLDAVISGKRVRSIADEVNARSGGVGAKARGGGRAYPMRDVIPEGKSMGSRARLEGDISRIDKVMDSRAQLIDAEVALAGDATVPKINQLRDRFDREAIRGALLDMVNREASRDSIASRLAKVRKEINSISPRLSVDNLSEAAMKESQKELERSLLAFQFNAEVARRLDRATTVMIERGLLPDEGMVRKIVNRVARQQLDNLGSESDIASRTMWRLQSILNDVRAGAYTDSAALHMAIVQSIDDDAASGIISRYVGAGDARRLRNEFIRHGGRGNQAGDVGRLRTAQRVLASDVATAEEKEAARRVVRATKKRSRLQDERKAFINDVLVPWYESIYGKARRKPTIKKIAEALDSYASSSSKVANNGALGVDASIGDMETWLMKTTEKIYAGSRPARQTTAWLKKAADPFVDPAEIRVGRIGWGTDLPTFLANSLERVARNIEDQAKVIARQESRLAEFEARAVTAADEAAELSILRQSLETPAGQRTPVPMSQQAFDKYTSDDLIAARRVVQRLDALKNDAGGAYFAAVERQQFNDLLNVFAGLKPTRGGSVKVPVLETHVERARKMIDDHSIFIKRNDEWIQVASPSQIPDDIPIGDIAYLDSSKTVGNVRRQRSETAQASERYRRQIERADELERRGKVKQAERIRTSAEAELEQSAIGVNSFREQNLTMITAGNKDTLESGIARMDREIKKLTSDKAKAINPRSGEEIDAVEIAYLDSRIAELSQVRMGMASAMRDLQSQRPVYFKYNGVDIEFTEAEWESLFMSGGDVPSQRELASELARIDADIDAISKKSVYEMELGTVQGRIANRTKGLKQALAAEDAGRQIQREVMPNFTREATGEGMPLSRSTLRGIGVGGPASSVSSLQDELSFLTRYRERVRMLLEASQVETQRTALEKARIIHQAIKNGDTSLDSVAQGIAKMPSDTASVVSSRRKFLNDVFDSSEEKALLDEVSALEESVGNLLYRRVLRKSESADAAVERLLSAADDIRLGAVSKKTGERLGGMNATIAISTELEKDLWKTLGKITRSTGGVYDARARWTEIAGSTKGAMSKQEIARQIADEVAGLPTTGRMAKTVVSAKETRTKLYNLTRRAERTAARMSDQEMAVNVAKARLEQNQAWLDYWADEYDKVRIPYEKQQAKQAKAALKKKVSAQTKRERAKILADEATERYDNAKVNTRDIEEWSSRTIAGLTDKKQVLEEILGEISGMTGKGTRTPEQLVEIMDWLDNNEVIFEYILGRGTEPIDTLKRFRADLQNQYFSVLASNNAEAVAKRLQGALDSGEFARTFETVVDKGMTSLAHVGLPSYQGPEWMKELFVNASRLKQPDFARSVGRFTRKYTSFFKAYAVSTPGFVVRNTMSNTFMLIAAGSDLRNLATGLDLYKQFARASKSGRVEDWLAELTAKSPQLGERTRITIRAMDASGYGRSAEALASFSPKRKWLVDNRYVQTFRKWNEASEGSARFMLAYDSVAKGADFDTATARVKRFLFDYESVSMGDEVMRTFVPFWFWMSRNLPMQMINIYENPRAYLLYNRAMNAIGQEDPEGFTPSWIREQGGVFIGGSMYLTPDIGYNRVGQQLAELQDPKRLLSYVNPLLRVPFETALSSRRFYNDVPFSTRGQQPVGGPLSPAVEALAALLGQEKPLAGGGVGVSDKMNYAAMNLIPPLAQSERLIPSTDLYKGRQIGSLLGYLGVPLRQVTPQMRESERRRQLEQRKD